MARGWETPVWLLLLVFGVGTSAISCLYQSGVDSFVTDNTNCTYFTVQAGATVDVTGDVPLVICVAGRMLIQGTMTVSGDAKHQFFVAQDILVTGTINFEQARFAAQIFNITSSGIVSGLGVIGPPRGQGFPGTCAFDISPYCGGYGGAHAGYGGAGSNNLPATPGTIGNLTGSNTTGSSGGRGQVFNASPGGAGGGLIEIIAYGVYMTAESTFTAAGVKPVNGAGGGGSGGSVVITCHTACLGTIQVQGGNGGYHPTFGTGGGGSGGFFVMEYQVSIVGVCPTRDIRVQGGQGFLLGTPGTCSVDLQFWDDNSGYLTCPASYSTTGTSAGTFGTDAGNSATFSGTQSGELTSHTRTASSSASTTTTSQGTVGSKTSSTAGSSSSSTSTTGGSSTTTPTTSGPATTTSPSTLGSITASGGGSTSSPTTMSTSTGQGTGAATDVSSTASSSTGGSAGGDAVINSSGSTAPASSDAGLIAGLSVFLVILLLAALGLTIYYLSRRGQKKKEKEKASPSHAAAREKSLQMDFANEGTEVSSVNPIFGADASTPSPASSSAYTVYSRPVSTSTVVPSETSTRGFKLGREQTMVMHFSEAGSATYSLGDLKKAREVAEPTAHYNLRQTRRAAQVREMIAAPGSTLLGKGLTAEVYRVKYSDDWVAVKIFKQSDPASVQEFHAEVAVYTRIADDHHPHVLGLHFIVSEAEMYSLVVDTADGGSLAEVVSGKLAMNTKAKRTAIGGIASGMAFLHTNAIVHLDLKPSNVLRMRDGTVKIADFGASKTCDDGDEIVEHAFVGTPHYSPVERLNGGGSKIRLKPTDVYAFGACVWAIYAGATPFSGDDPAIMITKKTRDPREVFIKTWSEGGDVYDLMLQCCQPDPSRRPDFDSVLSRLSAA